MKKTNKYLAIACTGVLAIAGCQKPEMEDAANAAGQTTVIEATLSDEGIESKTQMTPGADADTYKVEWQAGDAVQMNGNPSTAIAIKEDASNASFTFEGASFDAPYYAVYPAAAATAFADGTYTLSLPKTQAYVGSDKFSPEASLMLGYSAESGKVAFRHAMAYIRLTLSAGDAPVRSVTFESNNQEAMAGAFKATCTDGAWTLAKETGSVYAVDLVCEGEGAAIGDKMLVAIPAGTYAEGFRIVVKDTQSHYMVKKSTAQFIAEAGGIYDMSFDFVSQGTVVEGDIYTVSDWTAFAKSVAGGNTYEGKTVTLRSNLSVDTYFEYANGTFEGTFDGNGKTMTANGNKWPLFGTIGANSVVKNLTMDGKFTEFANYGEAGNATIAKINLGLIENCTNYADTEITGYTKSIVFGSIVGQNGGTIKECYNHGDISITVAMSVNAVDAGFYGGGLARMLDIVKAPDFPGGAQIIYDREQMKKIYETGVGSFKMRAKYEYVKSENCIDVLEIPYSSCIETIMKKATDMIKVGKLREVSDVRDAIDLNGFKLTFDLKKEANPELVMQKLFAATELENNFDCNFNILVEGTPMQLGVREILGEWIKFRMKCVTRELKYDLDKKETKCELLRGLATIMLDIDKAIRIIRHTEKDEDVVPNLAAGFGLTTPQAEYIAEIKLRNINREYIFNRIQEIKSLTEEIEDIKATLKDELKLKAKIIAQLQEIKKKYGKPRKTEIVEKTEDALPKEDIFFENYNCRLVMTKSGYFKKLSVQAARSADEHKLKEGDFVIYEEDTDNRGDVLFFTDKGQIYRARVSDFDLSKASNMGDYIPSKLGMDDDEHVINCKMIYDIVPTHHMIYVFENGKGVRVPMSVYEAKSRRKKITGAFSTASKPVGAIYEGDKPIQVFIRSDANKAMLIKSSLIPEKTTRTAAGVQLLQLPKKGNVKVDIATERIDLIGEEAAKCKKLAIPSAGTLIGQLQFDI